MLQSTTTKQLLKGAFLATSVAVAGPITTVPWNGYTGAASFGFDDGRGSQFTNLMPQLDKLGIKGTFFLANSMYTFPSQKADWIAAAKKGHELANHSGNHNAPTQANVAEMAKTLRALDPVVEAVTYAYPNCTVTSDGDVEAFLSRGCQFGSSQTRYSWGTEPNWKNIAGLCIQPNTAAAVNTFLDGAKSGNSWGVVFTHDVIASPDQYSVSVSDNLTILEKAVSNKLWIATYAEVGAYYRAHFTMDKVAASGAGPWNLTWNSPHAKMPKSVKLKVKLDAATFGSKFTVSQDNVAILANTDGSYTIDFMKLKLAVATGSSGIARPSAGKLDEMSLRRTTSEIVLTGIGNTSFDLAIRSLSGRILASKRIAAGSEVGQDRIALDPALAGTPLLAVLSALDGSGLRSVPLAPVK